MEQVALSLGDFELGEVLGGSENVQHVKYRNATPPQYYALKRTPLDSEEAAVLGQLNHRGIVFLHGVFEDHGYRYLCLEFMGGGSLADEQQAVKLSDVEVVHYHAEMVLALEYLHHHRVSIIYRDFHPANMLRDAHGEPSNQVALALFRLLPSLCSVPVPVLHEITK